MLPHWHILFGATISVLILFIAPEVGILGASIIFLSSFLLDIDHYLYFGIKNNDHSLKNIYSWCLKQDKRWRNLKRKQKEKYKLGLFVFHGIEFLILLLLASNFSSIFLMILIGFSIHMIFDYIDIYMTEDIFHQKISIIYTHIKNKNKIDFI